MNPHSDQQLVRRVLARLPWFTLFFLATQVAVFALSNINDTNSGMFALQTTDDSILQRWAFDTRHPLKNAGFNILSSAFIHSSSTHLLANLVPAVFVLSLLELKSGTKAVIVALILGHVSALAGACLAHFWLNQPPLAAGISGAVMCAATLFLLKQWTRMALFFLLLNSIAYALTNFPGFVAHGFSLLAGGILFRRTKAKRELSRQL